MDLLVFLEHLKSLQVLLVHLFLIGGQVVECAIESEMTRVVFDPGVRSRCHHLFGALCQ